MSSLLKSKGSMLPAALRSGAHGRSAARMLAAWRPAAPRGLAWPRASLHRYISTSASLSAAASSRAWLPRGPLRSAPLSGAALAMPGGTRQFSARSGDGEGSFLADEGITFESLNLHPHVLASLQAAGLERPSRIQAQAIQPVVEGGDAVIAAETGSGKTLSYLLPVISRMLAGREGEDGADRPRGFALILCPNLQLVKQVVEVADSLKGPEGSPLVKTHRISGGMPPPREAPDVLVTTPAALLNNKFWMPLNRHKREALFLAIRHLVVDEADMMMQGGFERPMTRFLEGFRRAEKLERWAQEAEGKAETAAAARRAAEADSWGKDEEDSAAGGGAEGEEEEEEVVSAVEQYYGEGRGEAEEEEEEEEEELPGAPWVGAPRRQYVFAGATMPSGGKKTTAEILERQFPDATWVRGDRLHQDNLLLASAWVPVESQGERKDALLAAVGEAGGEGEAGGGRGRTMVFANSVASAEGVARVLKASGIVCARYHKEVPLEERERGLEDFRASVSGVMVCTDAAARGLDIPGVAHVIQAEFSTSAVDYLHRVGRTARAGLDGRVTSLYTPADKVLVDAMRGALEAGRPVERAFSRNRSFRNKVKKYGADAHVEAVTKGQVVPGAE